MSVINTNVKALFAQESLRSNNLKLSASMERLATGLRINSSKDDAAGLAISNRMTAQVRGLSMAIKNANDGVSMAQTADGAYGQVTSMLQRMRELAVQAANGTMTTLDRESLQLEIEELKMEIDNVATKTHFNNIKLLDGSATDLTLQTGAFEGDLMHLRFDSVATKDIGSGDVPTLSAAGGTVASFGALADGDLLINGVSVGASLATDDALSSTNNSASAIAKVAAINRVQNESGVFATVNETRLLGNVMDGTVTGGANGTALTINGVSTAAFTTAADTETTRVAVADAINNISAQTGVRAINTGTDAQGVILVAEDGRNIDLDYGTHTAAATGLAASGSTQVGTYSLYSLNGGSITIEHDVSGTIQRSGLREGTFASDMAQFKSHARALGASGVAPDDTTTGVLTASTLVINGIAISRANATDDSASATAAASSTKAASGIAIAAAINKRSGEHGVTAVAEANVIRGNATMSTNGASGTFDLNGVAITLNASTRDAVIDRINEFSGQTGVVASAFGGAIELRAEDGRNISISSDIAAADMGLSGVTYDGGATAADATTFYSTVKLESDKAFTVTRGADEGTAGNFELLGFREGTFGGGDTGLKVRELDVTTQMGAGRAITALDAAIDDVGAAQSRSGAYQNRLDAAISILSESVENISAARSRVLDTDYAQETTALAKAQIVQQAATAMLAQANQSGQSVLALLQ